MKHLYFLLTRKLNQILKKLQSQESLHFQFRRCKGLTPREVFSRYLPFFPNMERSMKIFISAEVLFGGICCKIVDGFTPHKSKIKNKRNFFCFNKQKQNNPMPIYFSVIIQLLFVCLHFFVNSDRLFDKIYL